MLFSMGIIEEEAFSKKELQLALEDLKSSYSKSFQESYALALKEFQDLSGK